MSEKGDTLHAEIGCHHLPLLPGMADPGGTRTPNLRFEVRCSIQLSYGAKLGNLSFLCCFPSCCPTFLHHHRDAFPGCGAHLAPASLICTCSPHRLGVSTVAAQRLKRGNRSLNSYFFAPQISYQSCSIHLFVSFLRLQNKIHCRRPTKLAENAQGENLCLSRIRQAHCLLLLFRPLVG